MAPSISDLYQAGLNINIIAGIILWFFGVFGSLTLIIIFSCQRQLRQCSSSQYIITASVFDFIFLAIALGYRIMVNGFEVQGNLALFFYQPVVCRIRNYITGVANFATLYTKCLCAFDQWAATCRSPRIRRFSSVKWARIFLAISTSIWLLTNVPQLIYNGILMVSGSLQCVATSKSFTYSYTYFLLPVIYFLIPLILLSFFGYFTYVHVSQLGRTSTQQITFRRIERQITSFIVAQTLLCIITSLPYGVQYFYTGITLNYTKSSYRLALEALIQNVVRLNLYISSAAPFYIYICLSSEIRRMVVDLYLCRRLTDNQIASSNVMSLTKNQGSLNTAHTKTKPISYNKNK